MSTRTTGIRSRFNEDVTGTSRDPYIRKQSVQIRKAELLAAVAACEKREAEIDAEIELLDTVRPPAFDSTDEQAPSVTLAAGEL